MKPRRLLALLCGLTLGVTMFGSAAIAAGAGEPVTVPTPDVAWWKLDEADGDIVHDASENGLDVERHGGRFAFGLTDGALDLNGEEEYLLVPDYEKPAKQATYSAWVYMRERNAFSSILKNWGGGDSFGQVELCLTKDTGELQATVAQADGSQVHVADNEAFPLNRWTLVTLTMDGSRVRLYKDAVEVASAGYNGTLKTTFAPLGIGFKPNEAGDAPDGDWPAFLDGRLDDVRIYKSALTADEIRAMFESAVPTALAVATPPKTTLYGLGDLLNTEGLTLTATYADGHTRAIPAEECVIGALDSTTEGKQEIEVSYLDARTSFEVTVDKDARRLTSIEIKKLPNKVTYQPGTELDLTGMEVLAHFNDGTSRTMDEYTTDGFNGYELGEQTVTVSLTVGKVTETATFTVTVQPAPMPLKVREATEWTRMWDRRKGWIGSDGIYSFNLNGKDVIGSADKDTDTFFIYSDSLATSNPNAVGVNPQTLQTQNTGAMMNHSAGTLKGNDADPDALTFYYGKGADYSCTNLFEKQYWLMDGVVIGDNVYVIAFTVDGAWRVKSLDYLKIPIVDDGKGGRTPDLKNYTVLPSMNLFDYQGEYSIVFGNGFMANTVEAGVPAEMADGYIYLYGYRMGNDYCSRLLVARVKPEDFENRKEYRFWNGSEWVANIKALHRPEAVISPDAVSNEASVTPITSGIYKGKYMAVYTRSGQGRTMTYAIADNPVGPFSDGIPFFDAPEAEEYPLRTYTYNAKAHPHLSAEGKLLVTYNMNNPDMWSATNEIYRSRWLEIDLNTFADEPVLGNVSTHKPVTASGFDSANTAPRFGVSVYWQNLWVDSKTKGEKWLQVDFGSVYYVSRYILRNAGWADGKATLQNTREWRLELSLDGKEWVEADAVRGNKQDKLQRDFDEIPARYARLVITSGVQSGKDAARVASLDIFGTSRPRKKDTRVDVARDAKVTVSGGADTAAALVNGRWSSPKDCWTDTTRGDKWAMVDLGEARTISRYVVRHAGVRDLVRLNTNYFKLQASDDGVTWRDIDQVDYNMHSVTDREVAPFTARYVRLYITKPTLSAVDVARLYSFELYAEENAPDIPDIPDDPAILWGDANRDNDVTTADARLILQYCAELKTADDLDMVAANVSGDDDEVTTADARLILQKCAELIEKFPVE